jgi:two-component system chemotaxis sensor kinase CheA
MTVLDLRMLPMLGLYSRLERAAMELSIQLQKPLQLLLDGQDVAVDKAVLNRIFDPLLHMLRNAIDHGLETPAERIAKGKVETGTIRISASIVPQGVQISMKDDGRGLDVARIRQKGIEKGLCLPDQKMSESEIINLIFEPGFSTASQVTDVSGRGIGLDVVKKELLNLGGQMEIKTEANKGTEFIFVLPTNVSLIDVLVVMNRGHLYCVPTQDVAEILDVQELKIESSSLYSAMINLRDRVVPILALEDFLRVEAQAKSAIESSHCVLVVHYQDQIMGLRVDGVIEQQQVFVRPLKGYLAKLRNMTGSTVLSNGEPSLILNVKEMADLFFDGKRRGGQLGEQSI